MTLVFVLSFYILDGGGDDVEFSMVYACEKDLYLCKTDYISAKEPNISAKEIYMLWMVVVMMLSFPWCVRVKEPYISAKEPYLSANETNIFAKEPNISANWNCLNL